MNDLHFGIAIGVNTYPSFTHLQHAKKDAEDFYAWMVDASGGGIDPQSGQAFLIRADKEDFTDPQDATPTLREVTTAMRKIHQTLNEKLQAEPARWPESRIYFYIAGHGIAPTTTDSALLLANATRDELGQNIPCAKYLDFYETTQLFHEVLIFADCCREVLDGAVSTGPPFTAVPGHRGEVKWMLALATQFRDRAYEPVEKTIPLDEQRGYFTRAVLEGLRGHARDSRTGALTSELLAKYVRQRVQDLTRHHVYPQMPKFRGDQGEPIVFHAGNGAPRITHTVTITPPPGFTGRLDLRDSELRPVNASESGVSAWKLNLSPGLYQVFPAGESTSPFQNGGMFRVLGGDSNVQL
jgi:uncharacterized caspase-like protein